MSEQNAHPSVGILAFILLDNFTVDTLRLSASLSVMHIPYHATLQSAIELGSLLKSDSLDLKHSHLDFKNESMPSLSEDITPSQIKEVSC